MQENKELELLREFFELRYALTQKILQTGSRLEKEILEIQKKNKLKMKIMYIKSCLSVGDEKEFMEILKELGYEG